MILRQTRICLYGSDVHTKAMQLPGKDISQKPDAAIRPRPAQAQQATWTFKASCAWHMRKAGKRPLHDEDVFGKQGGKPANKVSEVHASARGGGLGKLGTRHRCHFVLCRFG